MLTPIPGGDAHCGPLFEFTAFKAVYEELAKHILQAGVAFIRFFEADRHEDYVMKIHFMEVQGRWMERFYKQPFDQSKIDELRALAATIAAQP